MLSILCCNTAEASGKIPSMPIATSISNEAIPLGHNATTTSGNTPNIPIIATTSNVASPLMAASSGLTASLPLLTELNMESASGEVVNSAVQERSSRRSSNPNQLQHQTSSPSQNVLSDGSRCSSLSNDSFDDDDENDLNGINMSDTGNVDIELADGNSGDQSLPNLSVFGRQSPNNDSSLTTVTCTSGENSFELSLNESSSTSTTDPTAQRK
uniref:Protein Tube n=2 Tax=Ceratitis capitata TaxID=7213 RepID=W8CDA2_CERCA